MAQGTLIRRIVSLHVIFLLITSGFMGILLFEGAMDVGNVQAATIRYVGPPGPGNYSTIQAAIDNSSDGDTIYVWAGIYNENVIVNKTVSLIGNGSANTTIDGGGFGDVVNITADWVNVTGFAVIGSGNNTNDSGIDLKNVNNCSIVYNNVSNNNGTGIYLYNLSSFNTLENNTCISNSKHGIYLNSSSNNTIANNTCDLNDENGIYLDGQIGECIDNKIINNTCNLNGQAGLSLNNFCNNSIINNNTANYNDYGISINGNPNRCWYNKIINNTCKSNTYEGIGQYQCRNSIIEGNIIDSNGQYGMSLSYGSGTVCKNNTFYYCGLYADGGCDIDTTNTVNGKPIYYFNNVNGGSVPNDAGQLIFANCQNFIIENLSFSNGSVGVLLTYADNNIIRNISSNYMNVAGIYIASSNYLEITDSNCSNNGGGIHFIGGKNITVENNICNNNTEDGLNYYSAFPSPNNEFVNNNCNNNGRWGIKIANSDYSLILNNTCFNNQVGIHHTANNNRIVNNTLISNDNGVMLENSNDSLVYHNNFIANINSAYDNNNNTWNASYIDGGNYWSDYTGIDIYHGPGQNISGPDGIGDTPYTNISGGSGAIDYYPFMYPDDWHRVYNQDKKTWHVSIQGAINNASSGDSLWVRSGTYYENIIINKTISLTGQDRDTTKIIGNGTGDVVNITADWVNMSGFTVNGGGSGIHDAGVELRNNNNNMISNNNISNNLNMGVYVRDSADNKISNNSCYNNSRGIVINLSNGNTVENNTCNSNSNRGIEIYNNWMSNNNVINNICLNNTIGIYISASSEVSIFKNICNSNSNIGIELYTSSYNNTISNNTCNKNNVYGIYLHSSSHNNTISDNSFSNNQKGIFISDSNENNIRDNIIDSNSQSGINLTSSYSNIIYHNNFINNTIHTYDNGTNFWNSTYPTGGNYFDNWTSPDGDRDGIVDLPFNISGGNNQDHYPLAHPYGSIQNIDTGEIFYTIQSAINDSDTLDGHTIVVRNGTYYGNVVIGKSITLEGEDRDEAIINGSGQGDVIYVSADWVNVSGFTVTSGMSGILLDAVENCSIDNNNVSSNNGSGISLDYSYNNRITNNTCDFNNGYGIILSNSNINFIFNNIANSNGRGIMLSVSIENIIDKNICNLNFETGIYLTSSSSNNVIKNNNCSNSGSYGIVLLPNSNFNIIKNNTCYSNPNNGIRIESDNNTITGNNLNNNNRGLFLWKSGTNNIIFHNNFIGNTRHAEDEKANFWNLTYLEGGNYFDNWLSPDNNQDGFVDNPFNISGGNNKDYWPFTTKDGWKKDVHNLDKNTWHLKIQDAIDNADSGNTIWVGSGIYYENIVINKTLTLMGEGRDTTKIIGNGTGDVVYISADWVNVSGFTVTGSGNNTIDAGIKISNINNCKIDNSNISFNGDYGIWLVLSSNNIITNNTINSNQQGGIYAHTSPNNFIFNNTLLSNVIGGIDLSFSSNDNKVIDNYCQNSERGLYSSINTGNTFKNNTVLMCDHGIFLYNQANFHIIENNTFLKNLNGIYLQTNSPSDNIIRHNIIYESSQNGIYFATSTCNNTIINNTIESNTIGINSPSSYNNTYYNNNFINNSLHAIDNGINFWNGTSGIWGNYFDNWTLPDDDRDGIVDLPFNISGGSNKDYYPLAHPYGSVQNLNTSEIFYTIQTAVNDSDTLDGHTIKVGPSIYYENVIIEKSISLVGEDRDTTIINGSGIGDVIRIEADWVNVSGFKVIGSGSIWGNSGIYLLSVQKCDIFNNNVSSDNWGGIFLTDSLNNTITNNICNSNQVVGICVYSSAINNKVSNNICNSNLVHGITIFMSWDNLIINNTCILNGNGINIEHAWNNTIVNNNCTNNDIGINVYYKSSNNTVINNKCFENDQGICLTNNVAFNMILNNSKKGNKNYGIRLDLSSNNNTIYHNNFINNTLHAYDEGTNFWNATYPTGGNYFDNWTSPDANADGFVDNPYGIPGGSNIDNWPFTTEDGWKKRVHNLNKNTWHLTIQEGIDLADTGDTIFVGKGTYYENVIINKTITLIGEDRDTTIINGSGVGDVVLITADWVNITGFRIEGGGDQYEDAGIEIRESDFVKVENNYLTLNSWGGVYLLTTAYSKIDNNIFCNNPSGIVVFWSSMNSIMNNTAYDNIYGINLGYFSPLNEFHNNELFNNTYGMRIAESNNNTITNNSLYSNADNDFYLQSASENTISINSSFRSIYFKHNQSSLIVKNYLHLQINDSLGLPLQDVDVQVLDGANIIYVTSGYGGTDPKTDADGQIRWILITDRIYNGNITPIENITTVNVVYSGLEFKYNNRDVNMSASHFEYFYPNYLPGTVTVSEPANNTIINDLTPELSWNPSVDPEGNPLTYYIEIDELGGNWSTPVDSIHTLANITTWNVTINLIGGQSYQWRVRANDGTDNGSWSEVWTFTIELPIVIDLTISSSDVYRIQTIYLTSNGIDIIDPEDQQVCQFQYRHENGVWEDLNSTYNAQEGYWEAEYTPEVGAELGIYFIQVRFTNLNGTSTNWTMKSFTVLNNPPIGIIDTQINTTILGQKITLSGHGIDIDGDIINYKWISDLDGNLSHSESFDISNLSHGIHVISFSVQDDQGTWSEPVNMSLRITAPDLIIEEVKFSSKDITEGETITITAIIRNQGDADATNITVEFYDGEKKIGTKYIELITPQGSEEVSIKWQSASGDHTINVIVLTGDDEFLESDIDNNQISESINVKYNWTPWIILIIIVILLIVIFMFYRERKIQQEDLEAIAEMEEKIKEAKELGLPTDDLEMLLEEARTLREKKNDIEEDNGEE